MALDRQSIARRDFPGSRRGYDPAAVDAHLDRVADEVDALRRQAASPAPLSSQAGEQVTAIIAAAERGAQEIRDAAQAEAREHVAQVTEAADRLRGRIEEMERDVTEFVVDLRTSAERLRGDLEELQAGTDGLSYVSRVAAPEPVPELDLHPEPEPAEPAAAGAAKNGDSTAARIVALDMAFSGTPREETHRHLAENYDVPDRAALLDEVYAAAGT